MSAQHTPGPWCVEDPMGSAAGDHLWVVQEGGTSEVYDWRNLAVVFSDDPDELDTARPITVAERNANARLIAAAPDLLEALEEVTSAMRRYEMDVDADAPAEHREMMRKARAAIAKTRGRA